MPKTPELLRETVTNAAGGQVTESGPRAFLVDLITPGLGSSGYYSAEVLKQAAVDRIFPAGTQSFIDHQTSTERMDRPEGSLRNLAAVLAEDAYWDETAQALRAKVRAFTPWGQILAEMKDDIGASIRATADITIGEIEGRTGRIVERLIEGISVDFVTKAGRGGKIVDVYESARAEEARNAGQWIESRIHRDFTILADDMAGDGRLTRAERISLSSAIGDALAAFVARLEADQPQLYARDVWDEPTDTIAAAIEAAAHNCPVDPAGTQKTEESKEDTMATTEIEESELATLRTEASRATVLETERDEARIEVTEARRQAREATISRIIAEADAEFTALETAGLQALAAQHVNEAGEFDDAAFTTAVTEAAATKAVAEGAGTPRGVGQRGTTTETISLADVDESIDAAFGGPIIKEG